MERIQQLAVNGEGFVFDPAYGEVFTVNKVGLAVLQGLRQEQAPETIAQNLTTLYDIACEEAEKDVFDFISHLRTYNLMEQ